MKAPSRAAAERSAAKPRRIEIRSQAATKNLEVMFAEAHYRWENPLSAEAFAAWRDQLTDKHDEVAGIHRKAVEQDRMVDPAPGAEVLAGAANAQAAREDRKAEVREDAAVPHAAVDDEPAQLPRLGHVLRVDIADRERVAVADDVLGHGEAQPDKGCRYGGHEHQAAMSSSGAT